MNEVDSLSTPTIEVVVAETPQQPAQCVLDNMRSAFMRHVSITEHQAVACTLWSAFTWFMDGADIAPILNITSPVPRCGKTTLFSVISGLVSSPVAASNATAATLYRLEPGKTLLIDEADTFMTKRELAGIVNSGHNRDAAYVMRVVQGRSQPFSTWHAKVICGIGELQPTTQDRSIIIHMVRQVGVVARPNPRARQDELTELLQQLEQWAFDQQASYRDCRPERLQLGNDRAEDNWFELQRVAALAGGVWPERCRQAAIALTPPPDGFGAEDTGIALLRSMQRLFNQRGGTHLPSSDILVFVNSDADAPWADATPQQRLNRQRIAITLRRFRLAPRPVRVGGATPRGYHADELRRVFGAYLEPASPEA